jgi:hypothetical protein
MPEHDRPIQRRDLGSIHPKGHNEPEPTRCFKGETMTREARMMCGIILITVPTIQYGGYFLLACDFSPSSGDFQAFTGIS